MTSLLPAIDQFDLEEYVQEHGGEEVSKGEWLLICPSCGKDKLTVSIEKKTWHCWVCQEFVMVITPSGTKREAMSGAGGLLDLIQKFEECDRAAAIAKVVAGQQMQASDLLALPEYVLQQTITTVHDTVSPSIPFPECWDRIDQSGFAMAYCKRRGITPEDIVQFGLCWCWGGRYANRLIFPVYEGSSFVYFQARAMWDAKPGEKYVKALNPKRREGSAVSSEVLMNLDVARHYPRVCIVEGPIDGIHTGPDAVVTFGKKITAVQVAKLIRSGVRGIDLMWDGPTEREPGGAYHEMQTVARSLSSLFDVRIVRLPWGDPGDYTREQLNGFRANNVETVSNLRMI